MNSDLLDIVIGVVFVWLLFSIVLSAVQEGIGLLTRVRAKYLWLGIGKLFDAAHPMLPQRLWDIGVTLPLRGKLDVRPRTGGGAEPAAAAPTTLSPEWWSVRPDRKVSAPAKRARDLNQQLYATLSARVVDLAKPGRLSKLTSVTAEAFSGAVVDAASRVHPGDLLESATDLEWSDDQRAALAAHLAGVPADAVVERGWLLGRDAPPLDRAGLEALYELASRRATPRDVIDLFRANPAIVEAIRRSTFGLDAANAVAATRRVIEDHFERGMAGLSRWYRRQSRKVLVVLAIPLVLFAHANTIDVYSRLRDDTTLQQAFVSGASQAVATDLDALCENPLAPATTDPEPDPLAAANEKLECVRDVVERANKFQVGLAWQDLMDAHGSTGDEASLELADVGPYLHDALFDDWGLLGRAITLGALMFGAQFWFDALRRLIGFRKTLSGTTSGSGTT